MTAIRIVGILLAVYALAAEVAAVRAVRTRSRLYIARDLAAASEIHDERAETYANGIANYTRLLLWNVGFRSLIVIVLAAVVIADADVWILSVFALLAVCATLDALQSRLALRIAEDLHGTNEQEAR